MNQSPAPRPVYFISPNWKGGYFVKCRGGVTSFGTCTLETNAEGAKQYGQFLADLVLCEVRLMDDRLKVVHECEIDETFHGRLLQWLSVLACHPPDLQTAL